LFPHIDEVDVEPIMIAKDDMAIIVRLFDFIGFLIERVNKVYLYLFSIYTGIYILPIFLLHLFFSISIY
jgi:hypothetical protein